MSGRSQPQAGPSDNSRYYPSTPPATESTSFLPPPSPRENGLAPFSRPPSMASIGSNTGLLDSAYTGIHGASYRDTSFPHELSDKFSLSSDPNSWGTNNDVDQPEPDDYLHNPDPRRDHKYDRGGPICTCRGLANLGCLAILVAGLLMLFAGFPILSYVEKHVLNDYGAFNAGGTNATGQVPSMMGDYGLIDLDTPKDVYTKKSDRDGAEMQLVFSDEFNVDGRTFYPGDDPYWEAVSLHYWQTGNIEWYDPAAITTRNGSLEITLSEKNTHDLDYQGGMMSTWNKFCFTGGRFEARVVLPGMNNIAGLWPAIWSMGNLGRAGYGASLEGTWPYTYDSCDVGTVANQTLNGSPAAAHLVKGEKTELSILPGQRLSRCTCAGESHPGPMHSDGTFVGRSAPEIDMFEAQVQEWALTGTMQGEVSQSGQWAPFDKDYNWTARVDSYSVADKKKTIINAYTGGHYQEATSGVTLTNQDCYELKGGCYAVYGVEYKPGFDDAYITWIANDEAVWTLTADAMRADDDVGIGARPVPQEPMYLIANLGMSYSFGDFDVAKLKFPTTMKVDWIRVYQRTDSINIGCDPDDFPTAAYINQYIEAYTNPNYTTWQRVEEDGGYGQPFPLNSFKGEC